MASQTSTWILHFFILLRLHLLCLIMTIDSNGKNVLKKHHHVSPLFSKWSRITLHHQKKASDRPGKVGQQRGLEEIRFLSNISVLPFFRDRRLPDHKDWMCGNIGKPVRTQYVVCVERCQISKCGGATWRLMNRVLSKLLSAKPWSGSHWNDDDTTRQHEKIIQH